MTELPVSVVIGSYNRKKFLELAVASIRRELKSTRGEIIVVDGGSNDGTLPWLIRQRDVIAIVQHNRGVWRGRPIERRSWGYFMNLGFKAAQGKYVCMLSDDCLLVPRAISNGIAQAERLLEERRRIGAVAFYWRNWPGRNRYWVGRTFGGKLFVNHGLYLKEALAAVGYADEDSYHFYHADGDLCLRLWLAGYECVPAPDSFVEHYAEANRGVRASNTEGQKRDWEMYMARWSHLERDRDPESAGDAIYRDYTDTHDTASEFNKIAEVRIGRARAALARAAMAAKKAVRGLAGGGR